ncbi:hypothetical protein FOVG_19692 [Fusarium oxysporum f. sp. pisi HDV247]|uniref:Uncharacterized protein n=1 Tax=Fusarium oxysporum f. sp. pisi HDV247 TaxID=1080344 RepID=W9NLF9_FUSOX|nr:hypothetical protein FOVG_19692 [Fusarium oxysporum f. sp. pisi HDV247]
MCFMIIQYRTTSLPRTTTRCCIGTLEHSTEMENPTSLKLIILMKTDGCMTATITAKITITQPLLIMFWPVL